MTHANQYKGKPLTLKMIKGWRGKYFLGWESRGIVAAALDGAT